MRVVYLCLQPRSGNGASNSHVDGIVDALRTEGLDVELLELQTQAQSLLIRFAAGLWLQIRNLRKLRTADAVYVRMHPTAALLPWLVGETPVLVEVNGVPEDYAVAHPRLRPVQPAIGAAIRRLLQHARSVLVVTEGLGRRVQEWAPRAQVTVVPNAADPLRFRPDLPRPGDAPEAPYAIYFGALAPWQGLELVLEAAQRSTWPSELHLVVIGEGPTSELVRKASLNAPQRITALGARPPDRLAGYVANAELSFVVKTYHDQVAGQSPLKLYESVAAGTPVVATPSHGCTDVDSLRPVVFEAEATADGLIDAVHRCRSASKAHLNETFDLARSKETWRQRGRSLLPLLTTE